MVKTGCDSRKSSTASCLFTCCLFTELNRVNEVNGSSGSLDGAGRERAINYWRKRKRERGRRVKVNTRRGRVKVMV